ncbi:MAG: exodeoxyribonuclease VII large subunit [Gammaproteobacteria bacterium]
MARGVVEESFAPLWLAGEVANFTCAASGHWYFVLRDESGQADCVMLTRQNALVGGILTDGDAVEVFAQPTIYPPRGRFQLAVRFLRQTGAGRLYQLFMERKREWMARGWFDDSHKKTPPFMPECVGVIGSEAGAAVRDVFVTLAKRLPSAKVVLYPAPAQGADAAEKIAAALDMANKRGDVDVLIVCRGGGGIEDLWAYNEEAVVSAIVRSKLPVITGIGHEIDETLADYAADIRAATPTAAAAKAVPDGAELLRRVGGLSDALYAAIGRKMADSGQKLDWCARQLARALKAKAESETLLDLRRQNLQVALRRRLDIAKGSLRAVKLRKPDIANYENNAKSRQSSLAVALRRRLDIAKGSLRAVKLPKPDIAGYENNVQLRRSSLAAAAGANVERKREQFAVAEARLGALNPHRTLERGYSITTNAAGKAITDARTITPGDKLTIQFAKGKTPATAGK